MHPSTPPQFKKVPSSSLHLQSSNNFTCNIVDHVVTNNHQSIEPSKNQLYDLSNSTVPYHQCKLKAPNILSPSTAVNCKNNKKVFDLSTSPVGHEHSLLKSSDIILPSTKDNILCHHSQTNENEHFKLSEIFAPSTTKELLNDNTSHPNHPIQDTVPIDMSPNLNEAVLNFQKAIITDSRWLPKILFKIKNHIKPDDNNTDLVDMLREPSISQLTKMQMEHNYPKGTSFCFDGYDGFDSKEKLIRDIKLSALRSSGTCLTVASTNKQKSK